MKKTSWVAMIFLLSTPAFGESRNPQYLVPSSQPGGAPDVYAASGSAILVGTGGRRALRLSLPAELVGPGREPGLLHEVSSDAPFVRFASPVVSASCEVSQASTICVLSYPDDYERLIDERAVRAYLTQRFGSNPALLRSSLERAERFRRDPEGVLILSGTGLSMAVEKSSFAADLNGEWVRDM